MRHDEELTNALAGLRSRQPGTEWVERVRMRCHDRLAQTARTPEPGRICSGVLEAATVAALWLYVAVILKQVAQTLGLRDLFG